jgi:uncharacterized protein
MAERPRDGLGRPLPRDSDPALAGPTVPDVTDLPDPEVWELALGFLDRGLPFHAHEVFEQRWRTCPPDDRAAWRAAAQWGAALTHAARGNDVGAARLARRSLETLDEASSLPAGFDAQRLTSSCHGLAAPAGDDREGDDREGGS